MSDHDIVEIDADASLKGKEFNEVCELLTDVENIKGYCFKKPDAGGRWSYCFSFLPPEYSEVDLLDLIVAEYGPGEYPIQFKDNTGRPQIRWQKNMHVQARRLGAQLMTQVAPATPTDKNDALALALDRIAETQLQMLAVIKTLPEKTEQKTTLEIAGELAALKDLFTDNKQSVLEQVKDVLELKEMLLSNDDSAPTDPMAAALKYLGPAIEKGMQQQEGMARAEVVPIAPLAPAPAAEIKQNQETAANVAAAGLPEASEEQIKVAYEVFSQQYLDAILHLGERDQEPQAVAEWVVRLVGGNTNATNVIGLVICQDDMIERLEPRDKRVKARATWLDAVANHLAIALWPEANKELRVESATVDATSEESAAVSSINDADTDEDLVAGGAALPNEHTDVPRKGNDNDA